MQKPTEKWKRIRHAALNRARENVFEPLTPLYSIYATVCVLYLFGFARFKFFDPAIGIDWSSIVQLTALLITGALVPILTGSVLVLYFMQRKLDHLVDSI